jgi:hypothetical protein
MFRDTRKGIALAFGESILIASDPVCTPLQTLQAAAVHVWTPDPR